MNSALIGYTGFVGSTLTKQYQFDELYNSKNIEEIRGKSFKTVICAGAPAVKWKANQEPQQDLMNVNMLMSHLETIKADEFILISTVDVYKSPINVDESSEIHPYDVEPYGKHRYFLEQFVRNHFSNSFIIRLPGLFGEGLKKNFIYDLIHNNCLHLTHYQSVFQFYDLSRLWMDIQIIKERGINLVNFSTEPVSAEEVASNCFGLTFNNITEKPPVYYDMKSLHAGQFNDGQPYMMSKDEIFLKIRELVEMEKSRI
ncbi:NAD-dependent epimerase/dehydratase family protein [Paenibacillus sp. tmac-D7]|uniref:NAD-dependent epimerase/dehydratase family protein n=1 Tax=Paenibacillus sp. tmac-D7 TaxID=2591462 RepID=UPI001144E2C1|nr:NAD-dependent epimerase/dehydratase family protein [Paenibacillus sp. tmac-D7]